jgi:hypothetical protein
LEVRCGYELTRGNSRYQIVPYQNNNLQINGQIVSKELGDHDILAIWESGLKKPTNLLTGFSQYRLPSGLIRLVYTLKSTVDLAIFVKDPFFTYQKSILGDISTYTCKVLNLSLIPLASVGSEVINLCILVLIRFLI